ncbi:MAG TPA: (deoxy)nucleoside triphosphate pyrophosphohydrolase [Terriglobia bacterium]|nr:(deoxy)nucleoside triphosphate pyrophosphohydrolase [Terriglobia bacterium]
MVDNASGRKPMIDNPHRTTDDLQPVPVTAGILVRDERILICQRHRSDPYGLQWEFPGGKVGSGETREQALRRELDEELAIQAEIGPEVYRVRHRYPDRYVEVVFFRVDSFGSEPRNRVFEAIAWARRNELGAYRFLDADRELVQRIARGEII